MRQNQKYDIERIMLETDVLMYARQVQNISLIGETLTDVLQQIRYMTISAIDHSRETLSYEQQVEKAVGLAKHLIGISLRQSYKPK